MIPPNENAIKGRIESLESESKRLAPLVKFMSIRASFNPEITSLLDELQHRHDDAVTLQCNLDPLNPRFSISYSEHKAVADAMKKLKFLLTSVEKQLEECLKELAMRRSELDDLRKTQDEYKKKTPKY